MKKTRIIVLTVVLAAALMITAAATLSYVFSGKIVKADGVTVRQNSGRAIYHMYATATGDYTGRTLIGAKTAILYPKSANYGKSHYMMVEYTSYPSFSYTIN